MYVHWNVDHINLGIWYLTLRKERLKALTYDEKNVWLSGYVWRQNVTIQIINLKLGPARSS